MIPKPHKLNLWHRNQQGLDEYQGLVLHPLGKFRFGNDKEAVADFLHSALDDFALLPAAALAAGRDPYFIIPAGATGGTVAASAKGGLTMTAATDTNFAFLTPNANSIFSQAIRATALHRLEGQVNLASIAAVFASFGWNENITDVDPTGTAGDGAMFLADPTNALTGATGATAAQALNWILAHKVNGADTFTFTTVPVQAAADTNLVIEVDEDLKANFYINRQLVGTGPALTLGDTIKAFTGVESVTGAKTMDVRFIYGGRAIG